MLTNTDQSWDRRLRFLTEAFAPRLALANLILLLPLSLVYYYYSSMGTIPELPWKLQRTIPLGIAVVLALLLTIKLFRDGAPWRANPWLFGGCLCLLSVIGMTVWGIARLESRYDSAGADIMFFEAVATANAFIYFVTGAFLLKSLSLSKRSVIVLYLLLVGFCLCHFDPNTISIRMPGGNSSYLFIGDAFAIWALLSVSISVSRWRYLLLFPGLVVSFTLITRAAFISFAICGLIAISTGLTLRRLIAFGLLGCVMVGGIWTIIDDGGGAQLLRGYDSGRIDIPEEWSSSKIDAVVENVEIGEEKGLRFRTVSPNSSSYRVFPSGFSHHNLEWKMLANQPRTVRVIVRTEKGRRNIYYTFKKTPNALVPKSKPSIKKTKTNNLYLSIPYSEGSKYIDFQRDIVEDIKLLNEDFFSLRSITIYGNTTLLGMKLESDKPDTALNRFLDRHFSQLRPRTILVPRQLEILKEKWFLGNFCGQLKHFDGTLRYYMHNYLSFWQQYGLIPFLLFCGLYLGQYVLVGRDFVRATLRNWVVEVRKIRAWRRFGARKKRAFRYDALKIENPALLFTFLLATFNLIEIIFARSYATPYAWLSLGMMPAYLSTFRSRKNRPGSSFIFPA